MFINSKVEKQKEEEEMPESEAGTPPVSAPATPGTPAPLFSSLHVDSMSYDRKSMPRCKCLPVSAPTWGHPHTCFTDFPAPDISLTRKVRTTLSHSLCREIPIVFIIFLKVKPRYVYGIMFLFSFLVEYWFHSFRVFLFDVGSLKLVIFSILMRCDQN